MIPPSTQLLSSACTYPSIAATHFRNKNKIRQEKKYKYKYIDLASRGLNDGEVDTGSQKSHRTNTQPKKGLRW